MMHWMWSEGGDLRSREGSIPASLVGGELLHPWADLVLLRQVDIALEAQWGLTEKSLDKVDNVPDARRSVLGCADFCWVGVELSAGSVCANECGKVLSSESLVGEMFEGLITSDVGLGQLTIWGWFVAVFASDVRCDNWTLRAGHYCVG